jgi:hypothetical protein
VFKTRLVIVGLALAIAAGVMIFFGLFMLRLRSSDASPTIQSTTTLLKEVQTLSQLVTVKYVLEKVVILEDVKWYGENRVLLLAHGVVKAGVDLQKLKPEDLWIKGRKVVLKLPRANITDVYLDEQKTQVIENSTGLLRAFDKTLEQNARRQAVGDMRLAAGRNGIHQEAEEQAKIQLDHLFRQLGYEAEVQFGR